MDVSRGSAVATTRRRAGPENCAGAKARSDAGSRCWATREEQIVTPRTGRAHTVGHFRFGNFSGGLRSDCARTALWSRGWSDCAGEQYRSGGGASGAISNGLRLDGSRAALQFAPLVRLRTRSKPTVALWPVAYHSTGESTAWVRARVRLRRRTVPTRWRRFSRDLGWLTA